MFVGFSVRPSLWLVVLPMISGFGLGIIYGRTFLENPGPSLPQRGRNVPWLSYRPSRMFQITRLGSLLGRRGATPCGCVVF
jgi:hypothetical protein